MILGTKIVSLLSLASPRIDVLTAVGSWDTPPQPGEFGYQSFQNAFRRFSDSKSVFIPRRSKEDAKAFDARKDWKRPPAIKGTPALGQSSDLKLMPFQVCALLHVLQDA